MFNINYTNILLGLPFLRLLQLSSISNLHLYPICKYQPIPRLISLPLPSTPFFLLCQHSGFQPFYVLRLTVIPVHLIVRRIRKSKQVKQTHYIVLLLSQSCSLLKFPFFTFFCLKKNYVAVCVTWIFLGVGRRDIATYGLSLKIQLYFIDHLLYLLNTHMCSCSSIP